MTKYNRIMMGIASAAACLATAGVANATVTLKTLTATYTLQSFTTTKTTQITFDFDAVTPAFLDFSEYAGEFDVGDYQTGPYSGVGSYVNPFTFAKNITITYELVPQAPEPATWAMMLIGFGAIGLGIRTGVRRKALAA